MNVHRVQGLIPEFNPRAIIKSLNDSERPEITSKQTYAETMVESALALCVHGIRMNRFSSNKAIEEDLF